MTADRRETPRVTTVLRAVRELEGRPRPFVVGVGAVLILVIGFFDAATDVRLSFAALYLLPISLVVWFGGRAAGIAAGVVSVGIWLAAHHALAATTGGTLVLAWNTSLRLALYLAFVLTLFALRRTLKALADALEREHELARVDGLTGVRNARAFREAADQEVARAERYGRPLTLAYLDADGFKAVNDTYGHSAGDRVLRTIAQTLATNVRAVDTAARLGGDEFGLLFPETGSDAAAAALRKLQGALAEAMAGEQVDVTFCFGVVTAMRPVRSVDGLLQRADALMYEVKRRGKNGIRSEVLGGGAPADADPAGRRGGEGTVR
ncbi:MAG: GGDEF domain-containing protein [Gemmatimonadales bacterium]|jgi:diguanylate cyclase (GGDEF)-like protein